jgi:hypothetical protein
MTLSGGPVDRALQALEIARQQILRGQQEDDDYRIENGLVEAEDAIDAARAHVGNAVEAEHEAAEEPGAAERARRAWRPARLGGSCSCSQLL